jgi:hypothetical protein
MTSALTWLDYSDHDRRRALELIKQFREQDTRDELGIGTIRDAISDILFPGTSTIQTRVRYFLLVPWTYLQLEAKRIPSAAIRERARREELKLVPALLASDDPEGTIGRLVGDRLKILPSTIYWSGLHHWGIRLYPGHKDRYHRSLDGFYAAQSRIPRADDGERLGSARTRNWHAGIPSVPADFPSAASLRLRKVDADYLRERILTQCPRTLLAFLVDRGLEANEAEFPWEHPQLGDLPEHNQRELDHARNFSIAIHGAPLLYNLMLSELTQNGDLVEEYRAALADWLLALESILPRLHNWNLREFWALVRRQNPRISAPTELFVTRWLDLALSPTRAAIADNAAARSLIKDRELAMKRNLSRISNPRAREMWGGAAGARQLTYRWSPIVRNVVRDIKEGVEGGASNA